MKFLQDRVFFFITILIIGKSLLWSILIPIWQTPDEQSHFAQLSYIAELRTLKVDPFRNLSLEVATTEKLLGDFRDSAGNNNFTYHPEYKGPYSTTIIGEKEKEIQNISQSERKIMVGQEASGYPPLYYLLALPSYFLAYSGSIIDRVFSVRLINTILQVCIFVTAYKIGREIWEKEHLEPIFLGILVVFQPMISFIAAGVHPDNLLIFLTSLGILVSLRLLRNGLRWSYLLEIALIIIFGLQTKVFMFFLIPIFGSVIGYSLFRNKQLKIAGFMFPLVLALSVFMLRIRIPYIPLPYMPIGGNFHLTLLDYLRFRLPKLGYEVWPWYWGVFRWLSLTLPIQILRIITRVILVIALGIIVRFIIVFRSRDWSFEFKSQLFLLLVSLSYGVYFLLFDFRSMQANGYSVGIQGRYFLPTVVAHMSLLVFGWKGIVALLPKGTSTFIKNLLFFLLPLLMIILNFISLSYVSSSYYDFSSLQSFLIQYSQYKPTLFKNYFLLLPVGVVITFFVLSVWYTIRLCRVRLKSR